MQIYRGLSRIQPPLGDCAVTIGNFDGVHLGHQAIVHELLREGRARGISSLLVTFDPHPIQVLFPERHLQRLFPISDMESRLAELGLDYLAIETFSADLGGMTAERFLTERVLPAARPRIFVVGHDFAFGAGRGGTIQFLESWCQGRGIELRIQPPVEMDGQRISSRLIRTLLAKGDVAQARRFLGRAFYLDGIIEKGAGRGKMISVPTMNMRVSERLAPKTGVYVTQTNVAGREYRSVSNLGINPTFGGESERKLETHVFNFNSEVYGENVTVRFLSFLRDERKFSSVEALQTQIRQDMDAAIHFQEDES